MSSLTFSFQALFNTSVFPQTQLYSYSIVAVNSIVALPIELEHYRKRVSLNWADDNRSKAGIETRRAQSKRLLEVDPDLAVSQRNNFNVTETLPARALPQLSPVIQ